MANPLKSTVYKRKYLELSIVLLIAIISLVVFASGKIDLLLANQFYFEGIEDGWPLRSYWLWQTFYQLADPSIFISGAIAICIIAGSLFNCVCRRYRLKAAYFLLVILLGPGLIINLVIKDHMGRPRPREIIQFNGAYQYQSPWSISDTGRKSFVCGHCSTGFMFFSLYFILQKGRYLALILTFVYSFLMGIARMSAGGHFISDIVWSGIIMFFICWFLYYFLFRQFNLKSLATEKYPAPVDHENII